jgi:tRNA pseudouridine38-40 synthase
MRLKLTIEYAGTRYSGWQVQTNARTVQGELERAVRDATGVNDFELYGSGRTDAGVHALAQVAHLDIATTVPSDALRRRTAFAKPFVWWVKEELSIDAMRTAAAAFVGFHDFRAFSDDEPSEKSTEVLVDAFDVYEDEDLILFHIEGSHFIWKMVRRMVGVLVEVGRGGIAPGAVRALLVETGGSVARLTAPASGLFLERVYYPGDPRDMPVRSTVTLRQS